MANKFELKIFPLAQSDIEQIFQYIAIELCNPSAAVAQIDNFEKAFDNICNFPDSCPYINNEYVKDKSLHKLVVNNYLVFYRVRDNEVQIIRVIYGMRNYEVIL